MRKSLPGCGKGICHRFVAQTPKPSQCLYFEGVLTAARCGDCLERLSVGHAHGLCLSASASRRYLGQRRIHHVRSTCHHFDGFWSLGPCKFATLHLVPVLPFHGHAADGRDAVALRLLRAVCSPSVARTVGPRSAAFMNGEEQLQTRKQLHLVPARSYPGTALALAREGQRCL